MAHSHQNFCSVSPPPPPGMCVPPIIYLLPTICLQSVINNYQRRDVMVIEEAWKMLDFNYIISYHIISYHIISYHIILYYKYNYIFLKSYAFKNTVNQRPGLPLHILWYATGNIPLIFPTITSANQLVVQGSFEDF